MSENGNNVVVMAQETKSKKGLKKIGIITGVAAVAGALVIGAFKMIGNKKEDDFDFDESFEDEDTLAAREYVNITPVEETEE
jgi:hypothetical protein